MITPAVPNPASPKVRIMRRHVFAPPVVAVFIMVLAVAFPAPAGAQSIIESNTILDSEIEGQVRIIRGTNPTPPTVVAVVDPAEINTDVLVFDDSVLNVVGGSIDSFQANDTSTVNFAGGLLTTDATAFDQSHVSIVRGELTDFLRTRDQSNLTIVAGSIWGVDAAGDSVVQIFGGQFTDALPAVQNSLSASGNASITLFGSFNYPAGPILDPAGAITGTLASGETFSARFSIADAASIQIAVPEPGAWALAALGAIGLFFVRRRRKQ
jgi:hypothetical protein